MKFGIRATQNYEDDRVIDNYEILNGKIKITYLDKSFKIKKYTTEEEQSIKQEMLEQARIRNSGSTFKLVKREKMKTLFLGGGAVVLVSVLNIFSFVSPLVFYERGVSEEMLINTYTSHMRGVFGTGIICFGAQNFKEMYKREKLNLEELKKYSIYLSIMDEFKNYDPIHLLSGLELAELGLPEINTLDHYSLEDIEKIESNLQWVKKYTLKNNTK